MNKLDWKLLIASIALVLSIISIILGVWFPYFYNPVCFKNIIVVNEEEWVHFYLVNEGQREARDVDIQLYSSPVHMSEIKIVFPARYKKTYDDIDKDQFTLRFPDLNPNEKVHIGVYFDGIYGELEVWLGDDYKEFRIWEILR